MSPIQPDQPELITSPLTPERLAEVSEQIKTVLSDAGAFCGDCSFEPGDRGKCTDCERCYDGYANALMPIVEALRAEASGQRDYWHSQTMAADARLRELEARVAELEGRTSTPKPPARRPVDPNSRAARLARIIAEKYPKDATAEPVDDETLTVYVTPASLGDWDWWLGRFHIPAGRMTYRGSYATATGELGHVKVLLTGHGVGALYAAERNAQSGGTR